MQLYIKILQFLKPFWKLIILSIFLSFVYVILNNLSLWVTVDFVRELFDSQTIESVKKNIHTDDTKSSIGEKQVVESENKDENIIKLNSKSGLYEKLNKTIKKFLTQDNQLDTLKVVCLVILLSFILKNLLFYTRQVINNFIELNVMISLRNKLFNVLIRLPISYFERHHSGKLTSIVFNDVGSVNNVLNNTFGQLVLTPLQILANMVILILISWKLSLITFTIIPITTFAVTKIGQSIRRKSRRAFIKIALVFAAFQEAISSIRIVKAFTAENKEESRFKDANFQHFKMLFRANRLSFVTSPLNETIGIIMLVVLLWYGGNIVYSGGELNAEDFIRFLVFLFTMFQPIKELSKLNNQIQSGMAAGERIFDILEDRQEVYDKPSSVVINNFEESIVYNNVSFKYGQSTNDPYVLNNINLEILKGEMVAFVGPSGAGKSTLVDLIPRFYQIEKGAITLDGVNINDLTLHSLRDLIGIVTQEPILFNETVRINIGYGIENPTENAIIDAAKIANAWEFIKNMENGLDTIVGERGVKLSGGQKQRLSIARAIMKNPPILILDEATSSLDTESEKLVQEAIDKLMENRTVLVIAHRLSTILHADKIVVIDQGRIVGIGTHHDLVVSNSVYKNLYNMQFRNHKSK